MSSQSHNHSIKQQFEQILKDTKILCELEPFAKKWSLDETLPNLTEDSSENTTHPNAEVSELLQKLPDSREAREKILRRIREIIAPLKESDGNGESSPIPFHQPFSCSDENMLKDKYDHELESTLKVLEHIEQVDAVSPTDIEEYKRGLGGKPDGPDLHRTTIREWKSVFLEHWFHLNQSAKCQREAFIKQMIQREDSHNKLKSAVYNADGLGLAKRNAELSSKIFSRGTVDSHFMTKRGNKNIPSTSSLVQKDSSLGLKSHSTCLPNIYGDKGGAAKETSNMLNVQGHSEQLETLHSGKSKKSASSANNGTRMMVVPAEYKKSLANGSRQVVGNIHYPRQQGSPGNAVNKINNEGKNALGSCAVVKANIEIQRFKGSRGKSVVRPSTTPLSVTKSAGVSRVSSDKRK